MVMAELYRERVTVAQVARAVGIHKATAGRYLRRFGITMRGCHRIENAVSARDWSRIDWSKKTRTIAEELGVSRWAVNEARKRRRGPR